MSLWSSHPTTALGWAQWSLAAGLVVVAVLTIRRDTRGRRVTGWDGLAVAFVVLGGPGAAFLFLSVYWVLAGRADRRARRSLITPRCGDS